MKYLFSYYFIFLLVVGVVLISCNKQNPTPTTTVKIVDSSKTTVIKDTLITKIVRDTIINQITHDTTIVVKDTLITINKITKDTVIVVKDTLITINNIIKDTIINQIIKDTTIIVKDTLINTGNGTVFYSLIVQVLPASTTNSNDYSFNSGYVTVNSAIFLNNGSATNSINNGIAVFTGLPGGTVQGSVGGVPGYSQANFTAEIDPNGSGGSNSVNGTTKTATVTVYLTPLNCTLNAGFIGDFNLNNGGVADYTDPSDYVAGITVTVDYADNTIEPNIYTQTTNTQGLVTFYSLPAGAATVYVNYYVPRTYTVAPGNTIQYNDSYSYSTNVTFYNGATIDLGYKDLQYTLGLK